MTGHRRQYVLYNIISWTSGATIRDVIRNILNELCQWRVGERRWDLFNRKTIATKRLKLEAIFFQCR